MYPKIFHTVCGKSTVLLTWSHYRTLVQELNKNAREWYEEECRSQNWSVRTLQRNISILLCEDTDEDIARYSVLHDNDHLFASKYMLYLPTPEQLRAEIERQKSIFYLKKKEEGMD